MNELQEYYNEQAGNGLVGFRGYRFQRGGNFFGRLLSGAVFPLLRFLGKSVLKTGSNVASDLVQSNDYSFKNLKNIAKDKMKETAIDAFEKGMKKLRGGGKRKKRRFVKKQKTIKGCPKPKKIIRSKRNNLIF